MNIIDRKITFYKQSISFMKNKAILKSFRNSVLQFQSSDLVPELPVRMQRNVILSEKTHVFFKIYFEIANEDVGVFLGILPKLCKLDKSITLQGAVEL